MNIIFAGPEVEELRKKYTVLELDTFRMPPDGQCITAYALLENVPINEMHRIAEFADLHRNLIQEYKKRNWRYCEDAIEHLLPCWNGELKSFYEILHQRILLLKTQTLGDDWQGYVDRTTNNTQTI